MSYSDSPTPGPGQGPRTLRPWLRFLTEGTVIVASILLAFGIDRWWEERRDRAAEELALLGLRDDFAVIASDLAAGEARALEIVESIDWLLALSGTNPAQIPVIKGDSAIRLVALTPTYQPSQATLDGLVSSGTLENLRSRELRRSLSMWRNRLSEVQDGEEVMRGYDINILVPYLAEERVPLPGSSTPALRQAAYVRLSEDPRFVRLVSYKRGWVAFTAAEYRQAAALVDGILGLLEEEAEP